MREVRVSVLLRVLLASIAINAVLGVWALLAGDFGETQGKVLATSFLVSAAMIVVLVNLPAVRRRYLWPVPLTAAMVGVAAIVWFTVLMWLEVDRVVPVKLGGSGLLLAGAGTLAGLMALVAPPPKLTAARAVHHGLMAVLVVLILVVMWTERGGDLMARLIGVISVLTAAATLAIPVLSRVRELRTGPERSEGLVCFCPACGAALSPPARPGESTVCPGCRARFEVVLDQG